MITSVGSARAGERRRQSERLARRARDREEAEKLLKDVVQVRQDIEERAQHLRTYADAVLRDAGVSPDGERSTPDHPEIVSLFDVDDAIDRVDDELEQVAGLLGDARARRKDQRSRILRVAMLLGAPLLALLGMLAVSDHALEVLIGATLTAFGTVIGYIPARSTVVALFGGLVVGGIAVGIAAAFGLTLAIIGYVILTVFLSGAFRGARERRV